MTMDPDNPPNMIHNTDWDDWMRKKDIWDSQQVAAEVPEPELPEFDRFGNPRWVHYLGQKLPNPDYVPPEKPETKPEETTPPETKPDETKPADTQPPDATPVGDWTDTSVSWGAFDEWGQGFSRPQLQYGFEFVSDDPSNDQVRWNDQVISLGEYYWLLDQITTTPPAQPEPAPQPEPAQPTQPEQPVHLPQDHLVPFLSPLDEYIQEQHPEDIGKDPTTLPWLAMNRLGEPVFGHDDLLHSDLGLPADVKAVQSANGVVFTAWDPSQMVPSFHALKDATPIPVH